LVSNRDYDRNRARIRIAQGEMFGYTVVCRLSGSEDHAIYRATSADGGPEVALKVWPADPETASIRAAFERDISRAARLGHPALVEVFDVGHAAGATFIAMELLDALTLEALLHREGAMSVERALALLFPVFSAVSRLHAIGVLHRNLGPGEILVSAAGPGRRRAKLAHVAMSRAATALPAPEDARASPYVAPELDVFSRSAESEESEQYALAAILGRCVTDARGGIVGRGRPGTSFPASAFYATLRRALNPDPSERFASVLEFARALIPFASADTDTEWVRRAPQASGVMPVGRASARDVRPRRP
jgi:serine/threonine protein kinase